MTPTDSPTTARMLAVAYARALRLRYALLLRVDLADVHVIPLDEEMVVMVPRYEKTFFIRKRLEWGGA